MRVFTNYPRAVVERFGLPAEAARPFLFHGIASRLLPGLGLKERPCHVEKVLHMLFGRWAARHLSREDWDATYSFSGVAEEWLDCAKGQGALRLVARGSAHIRKQAELLTQESTRTGASQEKPSAWRIEREEREYAKADAVLVLSSFAYNSFLECGFPRERLRLMVSGVQLGAFGQPSEAGQTRCDRLLSGQPLRVLNVGTFSFRKGMWDFAAIVRALNPARFRFRFVGTVLPEAVGLAASLGARVEFVRRAPQERLTEHYGWGDVFVFPTIEDGFPAVMAQASAAGLPMLTTPNGAGFDLVKDGQNGWVLPIRSPEEFVKQLNWCDGHRNELACVARNAFGGVRPRDWSEVASDFVKICEELFVGRQTPP